MADKTSPEKLSELRNENCQKLLSQLRWERSTLNITVGQQVVSTRREEDGEWLERRLHAEGPSPEKFYPYKPYDGIATLLTPGQVKRIAGCRTWYVNQCFAVEATFSAKLQKGLSFTALIDQLQTAWPQTEFEG